jgi:O-acetyl-ADP-ribose deacetylase (regulator of RNase III)
MKTLKYIGGNLLTRQDIGIIGHQANCQNTFGSGIARSIREMFPEAYAADTRAALAKKNVLGAVSIGLRVPDKVSSIGTIFNLYGQCFYGKGTRQTNYNALFDALSTMSKQIEHNSVMTGKTPTVGFPHLIGCGLGGGDWNIVSRLIEVAFDGCSSDVVIVKFAP